MQKRTSEKLCALLQIIDADPMVDKAVALHSLLLTEIHLVARFSKFYEFPTALWRMSRVYNADGYRRECEKFLELPSRRLDMGHSVPLRQEAQRQGQKC